MNAKKYLLKIAATYLIFIFNFHTQPVLWADNVPAINHTAEFQRIKSLEGIWEGTTSHDTTKQKWTVEYKVTSGGTAVVETLFKGSDKEMVSVYHEMNGKLHLSHYCMLGNSPNLSIKKMDASKISFELDKDDPQVDVMSLHMHALDMEFVDSDKIVQVWQSYDTGQPTKEATTIWLKRI